MPGCAKQQGHAGVTGRPEFFYFDLGNVIYFFDYALSASQAAAVTGAGESTLRAAIYDFGLEELYENGAISSRRMAAEIARSIGRDFDADAFLDAISTMFTLNSAIVPLIEYLQSVQIPMGILSNTCEAHWKWVASRLDLDFGQTFSRVVLSYEVGCMKPNAAIFAAAESAAGVDPSQLAYIDDRAVNVHAARKRGWQAMLFTDAAETLDVVRGW